MTLTQPQVSGRQRFLELSTTQTYWTTDGRVERFLAEMPLPGATAGRPMYLLYLRVSPTFTKASRREAERCEVRGFLVQTRGEYAGRVDVANARVVPVKVSGRRRELDVTIELEDASSLSGRLRARRHDRYLKSFETERRAGDVQSLLQPTQ
jgi:hypothetical protein